ncbi:MAG: hypothetical protein M5U28_39465 [Sandaracinaceae bacterium]|nr:hypothetical protein [Sandaracinaceae bacterium]
MIDVPDGEVGAAACLDARREGGFLDAPCAYGTAVCAEEMKRHISSAQTEERVRRDVAYEEAPSASCGWSVVTPLLLVQGTARANGARTPCGCRRPLPRRRGRESLS